MKRVIIRIWKRDDEIKPITLRGIAHNKESAGCPFLFFDLRRVGVVLAVALTAPLVF
jgi:hypothetical protein